MKSFPVRLPKFFILIFLATGTFASSAIARAGAHDSQVILYDSVTIDSRSFPPGHPDCSVGVFISNRSPLNSIVLPFEFRSLTPGSYISASLGIGFPQESRLRTSALGELTSPDECPGTRRLLKLYPTQSSVSCAGLTGMGYSNAAASIDYSSPDAVMYVTQCVNPAYMADSAVLKPGADTTPSAHLVFGVTSVVGSFLIDTACVLPANRLLFADSYDFPSTPDFRPAIINIECGPCRCHADPWCDGVTDVVYVIMTIARAIRGHSLPCTPYVVGGDVSLDGPTDINCSGTTDITDVVKVVGVAFRGENTAVEYCNPCD